MNPPRTGIFPCSIRAFWLISDLLFSPLRRWTSPDLAATTTANLSDVMITRYRVEALDEGQERCFRVERTAEPATWEQLEPPASASIIPAQELDPFRFQLLLGLRKLVDRLRYVTDIERT